MTVPAANPQALTEEMVEAGARAIAKQVASPNCELFDQCTAEKECVCRNDARLAITAALSLSRSAADRGQEACPFCGGDELNSYNNECIARSNAKFNAMRGQIVEECASLVKAYVDFWKKAAREDSMRSCAKSLADECEDIYAAIRTLSPAPAQTEDTP